jgi:hypothetical protein
MNDVQRAILQEVAEGRLTPEDAAVLLDQAENAEQEQGSEHDGSSGEPAAASGERPRDRSTPPPAGTDTGIERVRVVGNFRSARVVADPTVREAIAEGPHVARREGDLLVIESALVEGDMPGFVFNQGLRNWRLSIPPDFMGRGPRPARPPRGSRPSRAGAEWAGGEPWERRSWSQNELTVRMRPDLPLEVELSAGTLRADGLTGPLRFDVRAGSARIERARGPIEAMVAAGSIRIEALLTQGASRIRCDAGSVRLHLEKGSDVLVRARPELSKLTMPGLGVVSGFSPGEREELKIGNGTATLDIDANMSKITVTADT